MVKKIIILTVIICGVGSAYSQDCSDKEKKQAELIDSLQKVIKDANNQFNKIAAMTQNNLKAMSDTIISLKSNLSSLEKFKAHKKSNDVQLKTKSDSITLLKNQLSDKDKQITSVKEQDVQKAHTEKERGKKEVLANLVFTYKKPFDDLITSSSKESVQRDIHLLANDTLVKPILDDLQIYFNAIELLVKKFDFAQTKYVKTQINQIKQKSIMLDKLKETINKYQIFSDGLKETLNELIKLDKSESVSGMSEEIRKQKFNKIISKLIEHIFNYDFNFKDYPYLSDIILEIIKRKQPNADADISDLLSKL